MSVAVLIVDDDQQFRRIVELRLAGWREDLKIVIAENLTQARQILDLADAPFTIVILDQHLPDGLGVELLDHPLVKDASVLAVSADETPEVPVRAVRAGAQHFLSKRQVTTPLFLPLLDALIERKLLEQELIRTRIQQSRMETIKMLLRTLRHEINNPLGAVLGGAYLVRSGGTLSDEQTRALKLIEQSGNRIKHVIEQLCETAELEAVTKGREEVFQVPGDPAWEKK